MPQSNRRHCIVCGKHTAEVGPLSWNGYCESDGQALLAENVIGIATKSGPAYRRQLRGIEKYLARERARLQSSST